MERRPLSVTVISYFLMIIGFIGIVMTLISLFKTVDEPEFQARFQQDPQLVWTSYILLGVRLVMMIVTGHFMLEAANWARITYTCFTAGYVGLEVIGAPTAPMVIFQLVLHLLIILFLYLPGANRFFSTRYYGV
jgi:small-conductance mechanosensitive channel